MICHKCTEVIECGEAMQEEPVPFSYHKWYFHCGCYVEWKSEKELQETRLNNVRRLAGFVH